MTRSPDNSREREHRLPLLLQAMPVAFAAVMVAGPTYIAWTALAQFETTMSWAWTAPLVGAAVQLVVLRWFVRRGSQVDMLDRQALPTLVAVTTTVASASIWLGPFLPDAPPHIRHSVRDNPVGLNVAIPAALTWLGACAGLWLSRRRTRTAARPLHESQ